MVYCFFTRTIIPPDTPIKPVSHQTLSRMLLTDHNFTTSISSSVLTITISDLSGNHPCAHGRCRLYERHSYFRGLTQSNNQNIQPCKHQHIIHRTIAYPQSPIPLVARRLHVIPYFPSRTTRHPRSSKPTHSSP